MKMAELCRRDLVTVRQDATLREAAVRMCEDHVGCLAVVDDSKPPMVLGVVTDRDLALGALGADGDPRDMRVGALLNGPPVAVRGAADVDEGLQVMLDAGIRRVLVLDGGQGVLGLASADDVAQALAGRWDTFARMMRSDVSREQATRASTASQPATRLAFPSFGTVALQ